MTQAMISRDLRLLRKLSSVQLGHAAESITAGTLVSLGEPEEFAYDHSILVALPVLDRPGMFILKRDIDPEYWMCFGVPVEVRVH